MAHNVTEPPDHVPAAATLIDVADWLSPTEAARYLGISRETIYRLMREGKLPYRVTAWSGRRRVRKEDLDRLLQSGDAPQS
jgi:excisionase family DNA binding protein